MKHLARATAKDVLAGLGKRPCVVATLTGAAVVQDAREAVQLRADLLELRVDTLPATVQTPEALRTLMTQLKGATALPLIVTIRDPEEQDVPSSGALREELRGPLFEAALPLADFLDLELRAESLQRQLIPLARQQGRGVILSSHAVQAMPSVPALAQWAERAKAAGADVVKLAAWAETPGEVVQLLEFCAHSPVRPLVVIALGEVGTVSRVAGFLFGSCLTYGFIRQPAARGQLSLAELQGALRLLFPSSAA